MYFANFLNGFMFKVPLKLKYVTRNKIELLYKYTTSYKLISLIYTH